MTLLDETSGWWGEQPRSGGGLVHHHIVCFSPGGGLEGGGCSNISAMWFLNIVINSSYARSIAFDIYLSSVWLFFHHHEMPYFKFFRVYIESFLMCKSKLCVKNGLKDSWEVPAQKNCGSEGSERSPQLLASDAMV